MNLVDLSKVLTDSTLECCKNDVFPSDIDIFVSDEQSDYVSSVDTVALIYDKKIEKYVLVLFGEK